MIYKVDGHNGRTNLKVVNTTCDLLDELLPESVHRPHRNLISFVKDRPGHDRRYGMETSKVRQELDWKPEWGFEADLKVTVNWYLESAPWVSGAVGRETAMRMVA